LEMPVDFRVLLRKLCHLVKVYMHTLHYNLCAEAAKKGNISYRL